MAALTDRQKARERLGQVFESILDKMIPADEAVPLAGSTFVEWEDLGDQVDRTLVPVFLEERAALEAAAHADCGGRCPYCQSDRVYLIKRAGKDGKQVQRWGEALGRTLVERREKQLASFEKGVLPVAKANEYEMLVIGGYPLLL